MLLIVTVILLILIVTVILLIVTVILLIVSNDTINSNVILVIVTLHLLIHNINYCDTINRINFLIKKFVTKD